jgi:hypothetical protein
VKSDEHVFTASLAKIYAEQGYLEKAVTSQKLGVVVVNYGKTKP